MIISVLQVVFQLYSLMILIRILGSWFPNLYQYAWMRAIYALTTPYLQFFSRILPPIGGLDLSPILALFALQLIEGIVLGLIS